MIVVLYIIIYTVLRYWWVIEFKYLFWKSPSFYRIQTVSKRTDFQTSFSIQTPYILYRYRFYSGLESGGRVRQIPLKKKNQQKNAIFLLIGKFEIIIKSIFLPTSYTYTVREIVIRACSRRRRRPALDRVPL